MANKKTNKDWHIFKGEGKSTTKINFPSAPPWRKNKRKIANKYIIDKDSKELDIINASLYLKRPILITGNPGIGKSSLAYAIAEELGLDEVLKWEITTKTTLKDGLYNYDAIARLQDVSLQSKKGKKKIKTKINKYLFLGALGYAFDNPNEGSKPKVLLIDEIDKSDIDLPNDLLHIFEDMEFSIPELERADKKGKGIEIFPIHKRDKASKIKKGKVICHPDNFPIILMTSNDEREFPPAFLRRCIRLDMQKPSKEKLGKIIESYYRDDIKNMDSSQKEIMNKIIEKFHKANKEKDALLSTDQLLNAMQLLFKDKINILEDENLMKNIFKSLVD